MYKIESDFFFEGLRCVVIFTSMGHRCGYVGIDATHPLYRADYGEEISILRKSDIENESIGKRGIIPVICMDKNLEYVRPDCYFDVHGGITYSGGNKEYPVVSDLWWFGFDCAHYGDGKDYDKLREYELIDVKTIDSLEEKYSRYRNYKEIIRSKEYVEDECRNLAKQLNNVVKGE